MGCGSFSVILGQDLWRPVDHWREKNILSRAFSTDYNELYNNKYRPPQYFKYWAVFVLTIGLSNSPTLIPFLSEETVPLRAFYFGVRLKKHFLTLHSPGLDDLRGLEEINWGCLNSMASLLLVWLRTGSLDWKGETREDWMIYRGPGFLAVVLFGFSPILFPLSCQRIASLFSHPSCVAYWRERGEGAGVEPNHTTARNPGPL